jgi:hypothetical protein
MFLQIVRNSQHRTTEHSRRDVVRMTLDPRTQLGDRRIAKAE